MGRRGLGGHEAATVTKPAKPVTAAAFLASRPASGRRCNSPKVDAAITEILEEAIRTDAGWLSRRSVLEFVQLRVGAGAIGRDRLGTVLEGHPLWRQLKGTA